MKKKELAARLARQSQLTKAAAADQLDLIVHEILIKLKRGKTVSFPGLGTFTPGSKDGFAFDREATHGGKTVDPAKAKNR